MPINKTDLEVALSLFQTERGQLCLSGESNMVYASIGIEASTFKRRELAYFHRFLRYLNQDLWNIYSILHRLNWQKTLSVENKLSDFLWMSYAQNDINLFHVEFRSAMDYIARVIRGFPPNPWQTPASYNDLLDWIEKNGNHEKLDSEILNIVQETDWFRDIRDLRNLTVHEGGYSLVFGTEGHITFQTYEGWQNQVNIPEIMYNENIVDFELYAGMYVGYLLALYEKLSIEVSRLLELTYRPQGAYTHHFGLDYLCSIIQRVFEL